MTSITFTKQPAYLRDNSPKEPTRAAFARVAQNVGRPMRSRVSYALIGLTLMAVGCRAASVSPKPTSTRNLGVVPTPNLRPPTVPVSGVDSSHTAGYWFTGPQATPFSLGPGASGVCDSAPGRLVTFELHVDTPAPRCVVVRGDQWLRVVNDFHEKVTLVLGRLRIVVGDRGSVTVPRAFSSYLSAGTWLLRTNLYDGDTYQPEIRYPPLR